MLEKAKKFVAATWSTIKTACLGSLTIAWSYILSLGGTLLQNIESLAAVIADPNLTAQIQSTIGDPKIIGKWLLIVGIVTAAARLKGLLMQRKST